MKRILIVISNNIESGGVESYLINMLKYMDRKNILIDILVPGCIISTDVSKSLIDLGCNIITLNILSSVVKKYIKFSCELHNILKKNTYDIVHVNTGAIMVEAIALFLSKKRGVSQRLAHSHGTVIKQNYLQEFIRSFLRYIINSSATDKLACSSIAAESLFGKKSIEDVTIALNGIIVDNYLFKTEIRKQVRKLNSWENKYVIASVGRISPEKNYKFVLDVFNQILKYDNNCLLVIAGTGELDKEIKQYTLDLKINKNVQFLGVRKDLPELFQAFDIFVLASTREALGIVNIEAQASGLHCIVSKAVPQEVDVTGLVDFLSLEESIDVWAKSILKYKKGYYRCDAIAKVKQAGYDLQDAYKIIEEIYQN